MRAVAPTCGDPLAPLLPLLRARHAHRTMRPASLPCHKCQSYELKFSLSWLCICSWLQVSGLCLAHCMLATVDIRHGALSGSSLSGIWQWPVVHCTASSIYIHSMLHRTAISGKGSGKWGENAGAGAAPPWAPLSPGATGWCAVAARRRPSPGHAGCRGQKVGKLWRWHWRAAPTRRRSRYV